MSPDLQLQTTPELTLTGPTVRVWESAAAARRTPYLELDVDRVAAQLRRMRLALPAVAVHYAVKCNPEPAVLARLAAEGCGFEIASTAELRELVLLGVDPAGLLYSNPVKPVGHIAEAHQDGVRRFAADSYDELAKLARYAPGAEVYLRLDVSNDGSVVPLAGKYGCTASEAVSLLRQCGGLGLVPYGLTFHVGSQALDVRAWTRSIAACAEIMRTLAGEGIQLQMLDLGGGFPVSYDLAVPDIAEIGRAITAATLLLPYEVALTAEPGRYLTAEAGTMVATVIGRARRRGTEWVHLDVGAFGGLMEALETNRGLHYPVSCLHGHSGAPTLAPMSVTGPTCDSEDTVLIDAPVCADLVTGDLVRIACTGAYTTAYASEFNGFDMPTTLIL
ncbi:type III PLP-dependent enzyme [Acidothermaceae bacterium B102]|nr:type III PLP-dependent enzyme [Acidothermaceae bacterium B102]